MCKTVLIFEYILVSLDFYGRIPCTRWVLTADFYFSQFWMHRSPKSQWWGSVSGEGSLSASQSQVVISAQSSCRRRVTSGKGYEFQYLKAWLLYNSYKKGSRHWGYFLLSISGCASYENKEQSQRLQELWYNPKVQRNIYRETDKTTD